MEKVSIIIPTYNREKMIEKSIRSVLNQTYKNIELIVVDDGSIDNTEEIVMSINDERIIYYKQENGGASKARNAGVLLATSDYIAFHDSDDVWRENKLEKQMSYMKEHPQYGMVYCDYLIHKADGQSRIIPGDLQLIGKVEGDMFSTLLIDNIIGTPTMLIKKDLFMKLGGFDISLRCLEDWDFAVRFSEFYYIGYVNEVLIDVYQQFGSVSTNIAGNFETKCKIIAKYKDVLWEYGLFDYVVGNLFKSATKYNCLEIVKMFLTQLIVTK